MKHQWMPLFWGDFLANTLHLSAQEVGAYFLLIAHAWEHRGAIPYEAARRIARIDSKYWPKVRAAIEPFFEVERDSKERPYRLVHMRVVSELARADEISNKRKGAALQMHSKRNAHAHANHDAKRLQNSRTTKKDIKPSFLTVPRESEEEPPQEVADKKRPDQISRQELEVRFAAKRTAGEE